MGRCSHRPRRYLHIEAVFASDPDLDHVSAALAGKPKLICRQHCEIAAQSNESQTQVVASRVDAATGTHISMKRNTTMKTVTTFSTQRAPKVIVRRKAKYAAVAAAGVLGAVLSI